MIDRYAASLRAARPAGFNFEIAIAPDSNISRATRSDTLGTVFGDFDIGKDSQARSGPVSHSVWTFRRIGLGGDHSIVLRAGGSADLYRRTSSTTSSSILPPRPSFTSAGARSGSKRGSPSGGTGKSRSCARCG